MLEYSQGFWYRHQPKPSRDSWWALVDAYKWRIMVGVCFVGLFLYWAVGSLLPPQESLPSQRVDLASSATISDPWTHADGEVGAFTPLVQEPLRNFTSALSPSYVGSSSERSTVPSEVPPLIVETESVPLFFEEPDFVCEYLSHPQAFHYCVSVGESVFLKQYAEPSLSKPLPVNFLMYIFGAEY